MKPFFVNLWVNIQNKNEYIKKSILHTTTLMYNNAKNFLRDLFRLLNQGSGSEIKFVAGATKINLKDLKT